MPRWKIEKVWSEADAFIIGGGPSLRTFNWSLLKNENTIGCNTAFTLGADICKVCVFGDFRWWNKFQADLSRYKGIVFTSCPQLNGFKIPWLWTVVREARGLHDNALGWNGNTGASAINLAILFGVKRIFLLGFDMNTKDSKSNWHDKIIDKKAVRPTVYSEFIDNFKYVVRDWHKKFPNVEIWNLTKGSKLPTTLIPWKDPDVFWKERALNGQNNG